MHWQNIMHRSCPYGNTKASPPEDKPTNPPHLTSPQLPTQANRTRVLMEQAEQEHDAAIKTLTAAQGRVEHARSVLSAKAAARDTAAAARAAAEQALQVAKCLAEYFAASW